MRDYIPKIDNTAPLPTGILGAEEDNVRFAELKSAVTTAGITVDPVGGPSTDTEMLSQAMARYASGATFGRDIGVANAYILTAYGSFVPPKAYFQGMRVAFFPGNTNNAASTINAFTIGSKKLLRPDGSAVHAGDVFVNVLTEAYYDTTADAGAGAFRISPWAIPASIVSGGSAPLAGEGIAVDGSYHVSLNYPGLTSATPVLTDLISFFSNGESHHRIMTLATLLSLLSTSASLLGMQTFLATGTYTKTVGTRRALVIAQAPGGGGGGKGTAFPDSAHDTGAGGGAGGAVIHMQDLSSVSTVAVTIGAPGAGGTLSSHPEGYDAGVGTGDDGGDVSFGTYAVATGGKAGVGSPTVIGYYGGRGGLGTAGLVRLAGSPGQSLKLDNLAGNGGDSFLGGGGRGALDITAAGDAGGNYGGGGGAGNGANGGAGGPGIIIVIEFA